MAGKWSWLYAITGKNPADPNQPWHEDYKKVCGDIIKIGIILIVAVIFITGAIGIGQRVYSIFKPKPTMQNVANATFSGPTGGGNQNIKYTIVNLSDQEKPLIHMIPYVDSGVGYRNGRDKFDSSQYEWHIMTGLRFEFDEILQRFFGSKRSTVQNVQTAVMAGEAVNAVKSAVTAPIKTEPITKPVK